MGKPFLKTFGSNGSKQSSFDASTRNTVTRTDLDAIPIANGEVVEGALTAGNPASFPHSLGRALTGVMVIYAEASNPPAFSHSNLSQRSFTVTADQDCTVRFWVF